MALMMLVMMIFWRRTHWRRGRNVLRQQGKLSVKVRVSLLTTPTLTLSHVAGDVTVSAILHR